MHTLIFSFFEESVDPPVVVVHSTERTKVTKHATSLESEVVRNKKEEDKDEIYKHFPTAQFHVVNNAGHWVHAENPQGFLDCLFSILA